MTELEKESQDHDIAYQIVGIKENHKQSKKVVVNVQVKNSGRSFYMPVKDIYLKNWLRYFSKEDCTYLALLYVAEKENKPELIKQYPRRRSNVTTSVLVLAILYSAFLIISNLAGSKIVSVLGMTFPAVLIFFPFTYIIDDILTEVYGFNVSKKVIWWSLFANFVTIFAVSIVVVLPPSQYWQGQESFEGVFLSSPRILIASAAAYVGGEFLNAICLAKLKIYMKGKHLWFRSIISTIIGIFFDSIIFCSIAFMSTVDNDTLLKIILSQYLIKIFYAFIGVPVVYKVTNYLKKIDNVDVYDYTTKFNPFSL